MNVASAIAVASNSKALYRTIWRWHFYAGIFCIPFVIALSLTGAIYLFKPHYESRQQSQYHSLPISGERLAPNQQIQAALATQDSSATLMNFVKTLHGELLLGTVGSVLVELAACWAIVLLISGVYLW